MLSDKPNPAVRAAAEVEMREELFRARVEEEKIKIRLRISKWRWWHRFIPVVTITWRSK